MSSSVTHLNIGFVGTTSKSTMKPPKTIKKPKKFHPIRTMQSLLEYQYDILRLDDSINYLLVDWLNDNDVVDNYNNYKYPCFSAHFLFLPIITSPDSSVFWLSTVMFYACEYRQLSIVFCCNQIEDLTGLKHFGMKHLSEV